jgi:hypothetical protein
VCEDLHEVFLTVGGDLGVVKIIINRGRMEGREIVMWISFSLFSSSSIAIFTTCDHDPPFSPLKVIMNRHSSCTDHANHLVVFDEVVVEDPDLGQDTKDLLACDCTFFESMKVKIESKEQSL